jgi:hypothetical protein
LEASNSVFFLGDIQRENWVYILENILRVHVEVLDIDERVIYGVEL